MVKPSFGPKIEAGHILQVITMVTLGILYMVTTGTKADEAIRKSDDLRTAFAETRMEIRSSMNDITKQLAVLPELGARISQIERHQVESDRAQTALDGRVLSTEHQIMDLSAKQANINAATNAQLGPRGR